MPLADLTADEREIVRSCLRAAVEGPFFPDWEFSTLFGLAKAEVQHVLDSWPNLNEDDETVVLAINNSFNNLIGYPHGLHDGWSEFIPTTAQELARVYVKWKGTNVRSYFEGFM